MVDFDFSRLRKVFEIFFEGEDYSENKEDIKQVISRYEDGTKCEGKFEGTSLGRDNEFGYRWICFDEGGEVGIKMRSKKEDDDTKYARFELFNETGDPDDNERLRRVRDLVDEYDARVVGERDDDEDFDISSSDVMFDPSELSDDAHDFIDTMTNLGYDAKDVVHGIFTIEKLEIRDEEDDIHEFLGSLYVGSDVDKDDLDGFGGYEGFYERVKRFVKERDDKIFY